jgi:hypothetical protein
MISSLNGGIELLKTFFVGAKLGEHFRDGFQIFDEQRIELTSSGSGSMVEVPAVGVVGVIAALVVRRGAGAW